MVVVGNCEDSSMPPGDDRPHLETVTSKPSEDNESSNTLNLTQMDDNTTPVAKQTCNGNKLTLILFCMYERHVLLKLL